LAGWLGRSFPRFGAGVQDSPKYETRQAALQDIVVMPSGASPCCDVIDTDKQCCSTNHRPETPPAESFRCNKCGFLFCGACEGASDAHPDTCDRCAISISKAA
jgi:hypothetical protein